MVAGISRLCSDINWRKSTGQAVHHRRGNQNERNYACDLHRTEARSEAPDQGSDRSFCTGLRHQIRLLSTACTSQQMKACAQAVDWPEGIVNQQE